MAVALSVVLVLFVSAAAAAGIDPGEDFGGYVEELERRERDEKAYRAKLRSHEEWLQTTWTGFAVRSFLGMVRHFEPFFVAIAEAIRETNDAGERTPTQVIAYLAVRMAVVVGLLTVFYIGAKIIGLMIGGDIEVVEEIVIVHEHKTEEEAAKARAAMSRGKRQKQKSS